LRQPTLEGVEGERVKDRGGMGAKLGVERKGGEGEGEGEGETRRYEDTGGQEERDLLSDVLSSEGEWQFVLLRCDDSRGDPAVDLRVCPQLSIYQDLGFRL